MSSEQRNALSELFNFSPVPMWVYNIENMQILAANAAACKSYGYSADEFCALTIDVIAAEGDITESDDNIYKHIIRTGEVILVEVSSAPMPSWHEHAHVISAVDVTQREKAKETERQLRLSNERFNYASRASNEAIYDWDINIDHIYWADGFCRVFGYSLAGRKYPLTSWKKMVHPEDVTTVRESLRRTLKDCRSHYWNAHYRFMHALGRYLYVEETGYIIRDNNGNAIRMIGALRDITAQHEAAAALEASERRYSDLFHLSPLPMWVYDLESYQFLDVNEAAVNLYGYSKEEFLAMTLADIRRPEDRKEFAILMQTNVVPNKGHSALVRHVKKSGETMIMNVTGNSINYGNREARVVAAVDVTEKIKSREALANSERRFRRLIQEGSDLIAVLDDEMKIKYISPAGEHALGIRAEQLLGTDAFASIHQEDLDRVIGAFSKLGNEKRVEVDPFRIIDSSGNIRWVETVVTDMREDETIRGIIANSRDVTPRMLAEAERMRYIQEIEEHNEKLAEITWTQAHLVRAPLARILGLVELLVDNGIDADTKTTLLSYLLVSATELDDIIRKVIEKSQAITENRDN
ncbi:PAS domain S-box protein [Chitinophaga sp. B61]|uniref:histidine kinase n=2 Tax=Chitinophaga rhizophila TaxID=2866212 RepID=A0ABS7GI58_9BACT|nr:PAS domain S-box protein [Chitinophaga rhizophila]MBW8687385.1 PAS domain S-box protein [Chitinophaga rhizophila]